MIVKEIPYGSALYAQMKELRESVLRHPLGLILTENDIQGEEDQIHIAAIENNAVVGTVILKPLSNDVVKLRQMAVAPEMHGRGVGRDLVRFAEDVACTRGFLTIEMSARVSAIGFYQKLGFELVGESFTEVTVPTIKMVKSYGLASFGPTTPAGNSAPRP
jgi:ribosomal protein S18 acetylase RimI-like enzyme